METLDLAERLFGTGRRPAENRERPFDRLRVDILRRMSNFRANIPHSLAPVTTRQ